MPPDMKKTAAQGKEAAVLANPARHPFGPRAIGAVLPAVTRPAFRRHGPAAASLMADWPAIVGPMLAATAHPRRLSAGTLTLGCTGPVALELQHLVGPLIERVNTYLGHPIVQRLRFLQEARPPAPPVPIPRRAVRLDPVHVPGLPDGDLRDALAALGALVSADRA